MSALVEYCRRLPKPTNMFLVSNSHAGFGELPAVVAVLKQARAAPTATNVAKAMR